MKHYGKCALCGKECDLSFEHIPPRAAFNSAPVQPVTGDKMIADKGRFPWDTRGLHYDNQQKGMGKYSICEECNNNTGSWYGNTYSDFARIIHSCFTEPIPEDAGSIGIKHIYPLRIIKQVLSMFCSINQYEDERFEPLRQFVLNKNMIGLDRTKFKLCMYFTKGYYMKYAPLSVVIRATDAKASEIESMAVSEITAYPLGFILYFDPTDTWNYAGVDITSFAECGYNDDATVELPLCILEVNDFLPTFYRTKEEIIRTISNNKKRMEDTE